ncbi:unnamed protein product [Mytilus coruscus]|uniref:B box-type domain-containing protein n=1 Tax=Mytilus coruscus TaxID=42192 RepID=A0A6J8BQA6_MYTCO|nr:unnamed protein product [Mytilus coruscus]
MNARRKGPLLLQKRGVQNVVNHSVLVVKKKHDRSNDSINHKTISAGNFLKLPSFVSNLTVHCDEHQIKYEKYCPDHQLLLCKKCIAATHKTCKNLMSLDQLTKNTKPSIPTNIMKYIDCIKMTIQNIKQNRNGILTRVHNQIENIQKEISKFRSQLNKSLDNMEMELIKEIETVEKNTSGQLAILNKDLQEHENNVEEIKSGIERLEKYGTDFQIFLATNKIENLVHTEEEYIQSILKKKSLKI